MSGREWKPGDVADVVGTGRTYRGIYVDENCLLGCAIRNAPHWHAAGGSMRAEMYEARPLVVIDPEDREQVERLIAAYLSRYDGLDTVPQREEADCLQDALREFANPPPKPDEPTGLGAVVEDAEGERWVRTDVEQPAWSQWGNAIGRWTWGRIAAVRVLSEGVTP